MKSKVKQLKPKKIIRVREAEDVSNKGRTPLHTRQQTLELTPPSKSRLTDKS